MNVDFRMADIFSKYCNIVQEESFPFCPIFDLGGVVSVTSGWCRLKKDRGMGRIQEDINKKNELGFMFLSLVFFYQYQAKNNSNI